MPERHRPLRGAPDGARSRRRAASFRPDGSAGDDTAVRIEVLLRTPRWPVPRAHS